MNALRSILEQLRTLWLQTTRPARAVFVVTAALCAALIVAVGIWSSRPQFVPLATNLNPSVAAEIVSKLDAEGIDNQLNFAGSAVLVPRNQWNQARLIAGDQIGPAPPGADQFDNSMLGDPTLNHYKLMRQREEALARSIMQMDAVNMATVHIGVAEPTPFVQEQQPTTASVILELQPSITFTQEQAAAVIAMVAAGVEGLQRDNVTVMDTRGRMLTPSAHGADADIASQFEYRRRLEADLSAKAELMLSEMLGKGRAIVRVAADIDFTRTERVETVFDPESKVKKTEFTKSTVRTRNAPGAAGVAGTPSNLGGAPGLAQSTPLTEKDEENKTEYENAKSTDTVKVAGGTIKRLTIAAMVDLSADDASDPGAQPADPAGAPNANQITITAEQVEGIIKQAVGFDPQRDDQIEIVVTQLAGIVTDEPEVADSEKWQFYTMLARNSSLGLAAIVALLLGMLILRKIRPITVTGNQGGQAAPRRSLVLDELSQRALQNPEAMSRIISSWLENSDQEADSAKDESQARTPTAA